MLDEIFDELLTSRIQTDLNDTASRSPPQPPPFLRSLLISTAPHGAAALWWNSWCIRTDGVVSLSLPRVEEARECHNPLNAVLFYTSCCVVLCVDAFHAGVRLLCVTRRPCWVVRSVRTAKF